MSYNVENLFDTVHDEGKKDWEYLPRLYPGKKEACHLETNSYFRKKCLETDWTSTKLDWKIQNIKKVVNSAFLTGLPDILGLVEVENESVVSTLAMALGYKGIVVSNGPDKRGIDVALLYRPSEQLRFISTQTHIIQGEGLSKPTRPILEVNFLILEKFPLTIYVNHWPSQGSKSPARMLAAKILVNALKLKKSSHQNHSLIALGDFNVIPKDFPHPFHSLLYQKSSAQLSDIRDLFYKSKTTRSEQKLATPIGSYFYARDMTWNQLDRIFISQDLHDGKGPELVRNSYRILSPKAISRPYIYRKRGSYHDGSYIEGVPYRMNMKAKVLSEFGFSDHFALLAKFKF